MGRRLDFNKASRNEQARYGLSVKDEAEWMENDAAARWLQKNENRTLRNGGYRLSDQQAAPSGTKSPRRKSLKPDVLVDNPKTGQDLAIGDRCHN